VVQIARLFVQVARAQPEIDFRLLTLYDQRRRAGQRGGERLCTPHAAQARRQDPAATPVACEVLARCLRERFVGALHDALAADVDPAAGRHLAEHHQAFAVELVEVLPGCPMRHQVGVGEQHPRCIDVRAEDSDRFARLDQQRLVVAEPLEHFADAVETRPVARGAPDTAVDDQGLRILGHFGIEVVLQHSESGLGKPVAAGQPAAARRADHALRIEPAAAIAASEASIFIAVKHRTRARRGVSSRSSFRSSQRAHRRSRQCC
jgi:hypothetical protein